MIKAVIDHYEPFMGDHAHQRIAEALEVQIGGELKEVAKTQARMKPAGPGCESEDINLDGTVNVLDLIDLLLAFGQTCP